MSIQPLWDTLNQWGQSLIAMLPNLVAAVFVLVIFRAAAGIATNVGTKAVSRATDNQQLQSLSLAVLRILIIVAGAIIALRIVHLDGAVASAMAGVGIVGLALGFAFQDIAANFVAGVILALRRPYNIGDTIKASDFMGTVEDVGLRATVGRTFTGQLVTIPNKKLLSEPLYNFSRTGERRCDVIVGVSYGDDLDVAEEAYAEAAAQVVERDRERTPEAFFIELGDSSIHLRLQLWITPGEHNILVTQHQLIKQLKRAADHHGLTIPFPIRTLDFDIVGGSALSERLVSEPVGERDRAANDAAE